VDALTSLLAAPPQQVAHLASAMERCRGDAAPARPKGGLRTAAWANNRPGVQVERVIPATNALHSTVRYSIDPYEQLAAFEQMEPEGLDWWDFHPTPRAAGSMATDLARLLS